MTQRRTDKEIANDKAQRLMNGVNVWCSFYRANPQRLCKDYLNLKLHKFQQLLLFLMNVSTAFVVIAARGIGKTFLCAVFCVVRCILYPGTKIVITSKTRGQAVNVLEKVVKELMPRSANLRAEIKSYVINQAKAEIEFWNGSYMEVVTANDNARGHRANLLVCDEYRMIDKATIDLVLKKFLTSPRHPGYLDNPKYAHLAERNKEMYLSSSWFMNHWSWELCKDYFVNMANPEKEYCCLCFPYQMSVKEGLLFKDQIEDEMSESSFSEIKFGMEMECKWIGTTDGGLFSFEDINKTRVINLPFYAPSPNLPESPKLAVPPKKNGEIRILTADIALMNSKKRDNDATCIMLNRLIPDRVGRCTSNFVYTENIEGAPTQDLALMLRRYFEYFDCDYLGIDCKGLGLPIADVLMREIYDPATGMTYPAISCCNNPEIADRCPDKRAPKVLWAIMGSAQFNNDVALALRSGFQQGRIRILKSEYDCEELLREEFKGYDKFTLTQRVALQVPYINTGLTVNELVNLQYEAGNSLVRVHERAGCRKDRYSSISYNYYIAQQVERSIEKRFGRKKKISFDFRPPVFR